LAQVNLLRLQANGDVRVDTESALYRRLLAGKEGLPIVQEDLQTYFFRLWHIPQPTQYSGRFESNVATVRHMTAHLQSIEFNKAPVA
jgi:hypothetical protein